jgi:hypothetical protein
LVSPANFILNNPNFSKIAADDFKQYHSEPFKEIYKKKRLQRKYLKIIKKKDKQSTDCATISWKRALKCSSLDE